MGQESSGLINILLKNFNPLCDPSLGKRHRLNASRQITQGTLNPAFGWLPYNLIIEFAIALIGKDHKFISGLLYCILQVTLRDQAK